MSFTSTRKIFGAEKGASFGRWAFLVFLLLWSLLVAVVSAASTPATATATAAAFISKNSVETLSRRLSSNPLSAASSSTSTTRQKQQKQKQKQRPATSLPKRSKKKKTKRNKKSSYQQGPISAEDLADHVSAKYLTGPGSQLRSKFKKKGHTFDPQATLQALADQPIIATDEHNHHQHHDNCQHHHQQLNQHTTLVLNADYQPISFLPLSVWHWQDAIKAVLGGKSTVVENYQDVTIRAATLEIPLPSVIALNEYIPKQYLRHQQPPAFTKRNVFLRDEYQCQYCARRFHTRDLSLDHVVPRCRGGPLNWVNAVTCCKTCNGRKGSLHVQDLHRVGMRLLQEPRVPTQYELAQVAGRMRPRRVHPSWEPYLGGSTIRVG